jgi:hypothetical protein
MIFRTLNGLMAALFLVAVVVQYNDPDPLQWMAIYGAACVIAAACAAGRRLPGLWPIAVAAIALVWAASIALRGPHSADYASMFAAWEMRSPGIEEAREATGLLIVAAWMAVIAAARRNS